MREKVFASIVILLALMFTGCSSSTPTESTEVIMTTEAVALTEEATEPMSKEMSAADLAEYVQERTVTITALDEGGNEYTGSGFFIDNQGTLVTCYHVIDAAESIAVECSNGGKYDVNEIVDFSELYDIAVLKIDIENNLYLELCKEKTRTGETVYAVGSSLGFLNGTFSNGIVSNAARTLGMIDCVQTTASISEGNSGGPLVNVYGKVVGVNAFSYEEGDDLNLAININALDKLGKDKNWKLSKFREWYQKEISRSYSVWNYTTEKWSLSKINTYQFITERECYTSSYNWKFLEGEMKDVVKGYYDNYGVYGYEYHVQEFDKYTDYLNSIGFAFLKSEEFEEGTSYYYQNEFTGYKMDIFILKGEKYIYVEAYTE